MVKRNHIYFGITLLIVLIIAFGLLIVQKKEAPTPTTVLEQKLWHTDEFGNSQYTRLVGQKLWPNAESKDESLQYYRATLVGQRLFQNMPSCPGGTGSIVTSFSKATYLSNYAALNSPAWIIEFSGSPGSQCLVGTISANQMQSGDRKANYDLGVGIYTGPQECKYTILSGDRYVYKLGTPKIFSYVVGFRNSALQKCKDYLLPYPFDGIMGEFTSLVGGYFICIPRTEVYPVGNIIFNGVKWDTTLMAEIRGQTYSGVIRNYNPNNAPNSLSLYLGSNKEVYAQFTGATLTQSGKTCPSPLEFDLRAVQVNNQWRTVKNYALNDFFTWADGGLEYGPSYFCFANRPLEECVSLWNSKAEAAIRESNFIYEGKVASISSNTITLILNSPIIYPRLVLAVKADLLSILVTAGKPNIVSLSSQGTYSDKFGLITAVIKNDANSRATFEISASCSAPFKAISSLTENFAPYETKTVSIQITGSSANSIESSCRVFAKDSVSQELVWKDISIKMYGSGFGCSPLGATNCNNKTKYIEICQQNGQWENYKYCPSGCYIDQSKKALCINDTNFCSDCFNWLFQNKLQPIPNCKETIVWGQKKHWYDWLNPAKYFTISQAQWCPLLLSFYLLLLIFVILLSILLIKKYGGRPK